MQQDRTALELLLARHRVNELDVHALQDLEGEEPPLPKAPAPAGPPQVPKPQYETIRRNHWLSRARPKRLPRDEMETCTCTVIKGVLAGRIQLPALIVLRCMVCWQALPGCLLQVVSSLQSS